MKIVNSKTIILSAAALFSLAACRNDEARFLDLSTGQPVDMVQDSVTGNWVSADTRKPVKLYVDTRSKDTIYGPTGTVVNGHVTRSSEGVYVYDDADPKVKRDGEEYKEKYDNGAKYKSEGDETKYKDDNIKVKTEDGETKVKPNNSIGKRLKKIF